MQPFRKHVEVDWSESGAFHHNFLSDFLHDILDKVNTMIGITFPNKECAHNNNWDVFLAEQIFLIFDNEKNYILS